MDQFQGHQERKTGSISRRAGSRHRRWMPGDGRGPAHRRAARLWPPPRRLRVVGVFAIAALGVGTLGTLAPVGVGEEALGAVPNPGATTSVITVDVGGMRSLQDNSVSPVAGVVLRLYDGSSASGPGAVVTGAWGTCTSDADGDCSFVVPDTGVGGANRDRRFWIIQDNGVAPPAGYFNNPTVVTSTDGDTFVSTQYRVRTGTQLRANATYSSTSNFMINAGTPYSSSGTWPVSLNNPPYPDKCGLNVALVMDLSGSVADSHAETNLKNAAKALTGSLMGTPSQVALFTFGSLAPAKNGTQIVPPALALPNNANRPLTPVSTQAGVDIVDGWIDQMGVPTPHEATNWDRGMYQVAQAPYTFDVVIVLTDGNPTRYGPYAIGAVAPLGTGIQTRFVEIEEAVFSANALKDKGSRIIAVGVGDGVAGAGYNLAAISGPVSGDAANPKANDYYQAAWESAGDVLGSIALEGCTGSVTVVKQIVPASASNHETTGATPAGGWEFAVAASGATLGDASLTTAVSTGAASTTFTGVTNTTATVTITEQSPVSGYDIYPVLDEQSRTVNAHCVRLDDSGREVLVTNAQTGPGFSINVARTDVVSCTVYNKPASPRASINVVKVWKIEHMGQPGGDVLSTETFADGAQPSEFSAGLSVRRDSLPGVADYTDLSWGVTYGGMLAGDKVTFRENPEPQIPYGCEIVSTAVTKAGLGGNELADITPEPISPSAVPGPEYEPTLGAGDNLFEVTNTVQCDTQLTLLKMVHMNKVSPAQWTLAAHPTTAGPQVQLGPNGEPDQDGYISANVTPTVPYILSESGGDPAFTPYVIPAETGIEPVEGSVGSWICMLADRSPGADPGAIALYPTEGFYGSITVPYGGHMTCLTINYTVSLNVEKVVSGGANPPAATGWTFTVAPVDSTLGLPTMTGTVNDLHDISLRPGVDYTVTENPGGPAGYVLRQVRCTWDDHTDPLQEVTFASQATLNLPFGTDASCEFTNDPVAEVGLTKANSLPQGVAPQAPGQFEYVLTVTNSGTDPARKVDVTDVVPAPLRVLGVTLPTMPAGTVAEE
ncbi:MAG: hypothetical protein LBK72_01300, partial [Bifidobacteriaceae bacterium]|nr:hypothetical protein [Bifidobacteriaceae bacterium]